MPPPEPDVAVAGDHFEHHALHAGERRLAEAPQHRREAVGAVVDDLHARGAERSLLPGEGDGVGRARERAGEEPLVGRVGDDRDREGGGRHGGIMREEARRSERQARDRLRALHPVDHPGDGAVVRVGEVEREAARPPSASPSRGRRAARVAGPARAVELAGEGPARRPLAAGHREPQRAGIGRVGVPDGEHLAARVLGEAQAPAAFRRVPPQVRHVEVGQARRLEPRPQVRVRDVEAREVVGVRRRRAARRAAPQRAAHEVLAVRRA